MSRDPRVDPQPGDVLRVVRLGSQPKLAQTKRSSFAVIFAVVPGGYRYLDPETMAPDEPIHPINLNHWRRTMATAQILTPQPPTVSLDAKE